MQFRKKNSHTLFQEIEEGGIAVRVDKALWTDVGIRQNIVNLLLCYNPKWLHLALEITIGENIPLAGQSEDCISTILQKVIAKVCKSIAVYLTPV